MTTTLVTGACGFIGRHLTAALRRRPGMRLHGVDRRDHRLPGYDGWSVADLEDAAAARELFARYQPDLVVHLVGQFGGPDDAIMRTNVESTRHVLDAAAAESPAARVVVIGSAAEYGRVPASAQPVDETFDGVPLTAYGRAKQGVTRLAGEYARGGLHVTVARPFNPMGPGIADTLVVGAIIHRLRTALAEPPGEAGRRITIGSTSAVRDFLDVRDVAEGIVRAGERGRAGEVYNLCSGAGHSVAEVLERLLALAGEPVDVVTDAALMRAAPVDALVGNPSKAAAELGWRATTPLDESVRAAWDASAPAGAVS
ncbi:MAG: NAD-dependent epimerase/dehydratase family protein [Gemmatimonadetes bacterium]|nr:NAD-dependent epimerase/dehydratase family protein [Gemmatimonadota bacterium]